MEHLWQRYYSMPSCRLVHSNRAFRPYSNYGQKKKHTVIFYHGKGDWEACRDLYGMIDFEGENEFWKAFAADYRMNLAALPDLKEENYETGLRELIGMLKRSRDKEGMRAYCRDNEERFRHMDEETYDVISVMLNHKKLGELKAVVKTEKGEMDMCQAIEEMIEDGRRDGIRSGNLTKAQTAARNMYLRGMSAEDAAAICEEDISLVKGWFQKWEKEA